MITLNHLFFHHLDSFQHDRLLTYAGPGGEVVYSTGRFADAVFALRRYLRECGFEAGDRVAIFSENRPEWHIADFAVLLARMVVVPVYATLAPGQVEYVLRHSGCRAAIVGPRQAPVLGPLRGRLPDLRHVIGVEGFDGATTTLPLLEAGRPSGDAARAAAREEALQVDPDSLATIVYTSGTTGTPKGVMLSHANLAFNLRQGIRRIHSAPDWQALSVLPLAHVFERMLCYGYFHQGVPIAYGDPHELKSLLRRYRPQVAGCVPRVLEKIREAVDEQLRAMPAPRRTVGRRLIRAAVACERQSALGTRASLADRLLAPAARALVFPRVRRQLGPMEGFVCGGAWLNPEIEMFIRAAGYRVLQGYGMTETSPVIAMNQHLEEKPGCVGRPLEGVEVRIGAEGEVFTRGPHVMLGYYGDPEATRAAFEDGWLATGDLGYMDSQGFLTITGRRKELLVLSNGKNVACAAVEHALERSPYIQNAFAVGTGRNFVCALIVPHRANLAAEAHRLDIRFAHERELLGAPEIAALYRRELESLQSELAPFERAKRFCYLDEEALLDPELVTPTQKIRRAVLERKYAASIARLYAQEGAFVAAPQTQPTEELNPARA